MLASLAKRLVDQITIYDKDTKSTIHPSVSLMKQNLVYTQVYKNV